MPAMWPREVGVYALVFRLEELLRLDIGRLGERALEPGWYLYVGSARGPGGLAARLAYHFRPGKRPHWHVDYLTTRVKPLAVIFSTQPSARECAWVQRLLALPGVQAPWPGFGSSDCRQCPAHLLFWDAIDWAALRSALAHDAPVLHHIASTRPA